MEKKKKLKASGDKPARVAKAAPKKPTDMTPEKKSRRTLIIFTSVFLGLVLLFGIIFGVIAIVRNVRSVMIYKEVTITKGVANYLVMMGKYNYISSLAKQGVVCYDTEEFWNSTAPNGRIYGDMLEEEVEMYLKRIMVATHLYDKYSDLSADDEKKIENISLEILVRYGGSKEKVDKELEKIGCDYNDVEKATEMLYKYAMAKEVIFGYEGEALKSEDYYPQCDEFFATYTHAKLLFVRTEDKFVKDPTTGEITLEELTSAEKAEVEAYIENIRIQIAGTGELVMTYEEFVRQIGIWAEKDEMNIVGGYYFAPTSLDTDEFRKIYPEVVDAVYSAKVGEYAEVETSWGICFVYRDDPTPRAYLSPTLDRFFTDFYTDAVEYIYPVELAKYATEVKVKKKFYDIDIIAMPYNYLLVIRL